MDSPLPDDAPPPPAAPPAFAPVIRWLALIFLMLPLVLFVLGVRPSDVDNQAPASAPRLSSGWGFFNELNEYVVGRLPLRDVAIRDDARLSQDVFGQSASLSEGDPYSPTTPGVSTEAASSGGAETPIVAQTSQRKFLQLPPPTPEVEPPGNGLVTEGQDGWLYYTDEFYKECVPQQNPADVVKDLKRLARIIDASGRHFYFTLAPDKSEAEPQYLPGSYPYEACARTAQRVDFGLLASARIPGYINMQALIAHRETVESRPYYMRKDTHWNGLADALFAKNLAQQINPALLNGLRDETSIITYTGDLTELLGDPQPDKTFGTDLRRPGVKVSERWVTIAPGFARRESVATSTGPKLVGGQTLLIGDSFSDAVTPDLRPFFATMLSVENRDPALIPETITREIASSKTVVLVWVERYFTDPNYSVLWSPLFLNKLQSELPPVR